MRTLVRLVVLPVTHLYRIVVSVGLLALAAGTDPLQAQPIPVPNFSFESQSASGFPFETNPNLDSWQKIAEPAFYTPAFGSFGVPWVGTAGGFINASVNNPTPYGNVLGAQAGYILMVPQVTLFQDYNSSPTHDFDATFEIGKSYNLTIGLYAKSSFGAIPPGSTLEMSLYYRDGLDNRVKVGSYIVMYSEAVFPITSTPNLIDYQLNVPVVQAGDAWAGQQIGIQLESTIPIGLTSFANWDFDNVRLTAVPEPSIMALLNLGIGALWLARSRVRG
jgi:hypothetical protein